MKKVFTKNTIIDKQERLVNLFSFSYPGIWQACLYGKRLFTETIRVWCDRISESNFYLHVVACSVMVSVPFGVYPLKPLKKAKLQCRNSHTDGLRSSLQPHSLGEICKSFFFISRWDILRPLRFRALHSFMFDIWWLRIRLEIFLCEKGRETRITK